MMPGRAGLPDLVTTLEAEWSITTGACLAGGNFAYVCEAVTLDGRPAVLKVAPPPEATAAQAIRYAAEREAAIDPRHAVLVHGDAHAWNLLRVPGTAGFRLIDPEGLIFEPAHDLGVILRDWNEDLMTREPGEALRISRRRCQRAGRLTAVDPEAIWQWAFIERVSSGLFMMRLGHIRAAETFLAVAGKLTTIWGSNHD